MLTKLDRNSPGTTKRDNGKLTLSRETVRCLRVRSTIRTGGPKATEAPGGCHPITTSD